MATKKELIAKAVELGHVETTIKSKSVAELEELIAQGAIGVDEDNMDTAKQIEEDTDKEIVAESTQQLGIFSDYIYNAKHKEVDIIVENLGYGDVYVNVEGLAKVGAHEQRLMFKESRVFQGADKVCVASASQPVIQILEVK
ncbi:hypothetical protein [Brevibacillus laterosporus]|uniref:hypothetical protein n=1 Tax=Brevibacillus laterosporus TaxID=1465 RepID=UPI003D21BCB2